MLQQVLRRLEIVTLKGELIRAQYLLRRFVLMAILFILYIMINK